MEVATPIDEQWQKYHIKAWFPQEQTSNTFFAVFD